MERLKAILNREMMRLSLTERNSAKRFIKEVVENKDRKQAEIIYYNYNSYVNDLIGYASSSPINRNLRKEKIMLMQS